MDDMTEGASLKEIKRAFDHFFNKGTTLAKIKDAALGDKLFPSPIPSNGFIGIAGRSIAWKIFLLAHEPLETSPVRADALVEAMRKTREAYKALLLEKMRAPDGSYDTDLVLPDATTPPTAANGGLSSSIAQSVSSESAKRSAHPMKHGQSKSSLEFNNPLSLHNENPWNAWFASVDLRKTILQDVERTFPDIKYFRRPEVQLQLTNILYLYSVQHPSIGYRQGMHELLAPLYHAVAHDAIIEERGINILADATLKELCSSIWVAADAWALFEVVMRGVSRWYEWQEPSPDLLATSASASRNSPLAAHVHLDVGEGEMRPYITPIVQACNIIQGTMLRATDPQLFKAIQATGLEPQIYGIRWLRMLFTRELSMPDALRLWDGLFACDPSFDLAQWVCVAMLIRIRNDLIPADYSGQLTLLLRYPTPPNAHTLPHAVLLLRQALALQMAPNPSTGATIVLENRTVLDIPVEISVPERSSSPRRGHLNRQQASSAPLQGQSHARLSASSSVNFETLARGLMERGESLGINKTLMNAVTELKRNIPDLAASLVRPAYQSEVSLPLEDERPPQERPPWEPRTRFEMERDIVQLRARDKQIGDSLGWIVDVLLQDEEGTKDEGRLRKEKREAIESLAYIRDVLISDGLTLEEDRLFGEEEASRRKVRVQRQEESNLAGPKAVMPPAPLPVMGTRPRSAGHRSRAEGRTWLSQQNTKGGPEGPAVAPWNYTRSSFAESSASPSGSLPRPPPTRLRWGVERKGEESQRGYEDPLGAVHVHSKY